MTPSRLAAGAALVSRRDAGRDVCGDWYRRAMLADPPLGRCPACSRPFASENVLTRSVGYDGEATTGFVMLEVACSGCRTVVRLDSHAPTETLVEPSEVARVIETPAPRRAARRGGAPPARDGVSRRRATRPLPRLSGSVRGCAGGVAAREIGAAPPQHVFPLPAAFHSPGERSRCVCTRTRSVPATSRESRRGGRPAAASSWRAGPRGSVRAICIRSASRVGTRIGAAPRRSLPPGRDAPERGVSGHAVRRLRRRPHHSDVAER